jgi:hypothetical protein
MVFPLKLHGEPNLLPVDTCIAAMQGYGRCHTTRTFEPYAAYGFQQGDIAIACAGNTQVAFRVGAQYPITPELMADPTYQQQWATMEKHSAQELQSFTNKPVVWGLHIEPLGDYIDGEIVPFPPPLPLCSLEPAITEPAITQASPVYDPESLVGYHPVTGADIPTVQPHDSTYHPSRGELLEWLAVARVIGSSEQQEIIKALGLELRDYYNQEQGMSGSAPPTEYRHSAVAVNEQAYLQMRDAVAQLRESFSQMSLQPHQTPAATLHVLQGRVQHLRIQHEIR